MSMPLYRAIINNEIVLQTALHTGNTELEKVCRERVVRIRHALPSGSGFDEGTEVVGVILRPRHAIKLRVRYHHMNADGYYTEWTDHPVLVVPDFMSIADVRVRGKNVDDVNEYISTMLYHALMCDFDWLVPAATGK